MINGPANPVIALRHERGVSTCHILYFDELEEVMRLVYTARGPVSILIRMAES